MDGGLLSSGRVRPLAALTVVLAVAAGLLFLTGQPAAAAGGVGSASEAGTAVLLRDFCASPGATAATAVPTADASAAGPGVEAAAAEEPAADAAATAVPTVDASAAAGPGVDAAAEEPGEAGDDRVPGEPSSEERAQALACSEQSDRARIELDDPQPTEVIDLMALTAQEQAAVAQAVRAANEHLLGEATSSVPEPTSTGEPGSADGVVAEAPGTAVPQPPSTSESEAFPETDSQAVRYLTDDELTYREGETVPVTVSDRQPGIYVDAHGQAGVVFNDGSFTFFPQDVTVTKRVVLARSARALADRDTGTANGLTVQRPSADTTNVFNELRFYVDSTSWPGAPRMPETITVDATDAGTGNRMLGYDALAVTRSRTDESVASVTSDGDRRTLTEAELGEGSSVVVHRTDTQATVWYSNVSSFDAGRFQPTADDSRLPFVVAPRMTITNINTEAKTATVTYQFYGDRSAYLSRNQNYGVLTTPYSVVFSDSETQGLLLKNMLPSSGGNNCRDRYSSSSIKNWDGRTLCFPLGDDRYDKLSVTVPVDLELRDGELAYVIRSGFNSDWLLATLELTDQNQNEGYEALRPDLFDDSETYTVQGRRGPATFHLLETLRVQLPDVIISAPVVRPELPRTGGVGAVAFLLTGAGLVAIALVFAGLQVHHRGTRARR